MSRLISFWDHIFDCTLKNNHLSQIIFFIGGSRGTQHLSISCIFRENLAKSCVDAPPPPRGGVGSPPRGNPWSATVLVTLHEHNPWLHCDNFELRKFFSVPFIIDIDDYKNKSKYFIFLLQPESEKQKKLTSNLFHNYSTQTFNIFSDSLILPMIRFLEVTCAKAALTLRCGAIETSI